MIARNDTKPLATARQGLLLATLIQHDQRIVVLESEPVGPGGVELQLDGNGQTTSERFDRRAPAQR